MTNLYKVVLTWLCKAKVVTDNMEAVWSSVVNIKDEILNLLDTDNDGMRMNAIKFMEMIVIAQTHSGKTYHGIIA
jgi:symplekin